MVRAFRKQSKLQGGSLIHSVYYNYITKLESIGDRFYHIAEKYNEEKVSNTIIEWLIKIEKFIEESASIYRKFNILKIQEMAKEIHKSIKEYEEEISKEKFKHSLITYNIHEILLEIYELIEILYSLNQDFFSKIN